MSMWWGIVVEPYFRDLLKIAICVFFAHFTLRKLLVSGEARGAMESGPVAPRSV